MLLISVRLNLGLIHRIIKVDGMLATYFECFSYSLCLCATFM